MPNSMAITPEQRAAQAFLDAELNKLRQQYAQAYSQPGAGPDYGLRQMNLNKLSQQLAELSGYQNAPIAAMPDLLKMRQAMAPTPLQTINMGQVGPGASSPMQQGVQDDVQRRMLGMPSAAQMMEIPEQERRRQLEARLTELQMKQQGDQALQRMSDLAAFDRTREGTSAQRDVAATQAGANLRSSEMESQARTSAAQQEMLARQAAAQMEAQSREKASQLDALSRILGGQAGAMGSSNPQADALVQQLARQVMPSASGGNMAEQYAQSSRMGMPLVSPPAPRPMNTLQAPQSVRPFVPPQQSPTTSSSWMGEMPGAMMDQIRYVGQNPETIMDRLGAMVGLRRNRLQPQPQPNTLYANSYYR